MILVDANLLLYAVVSDYEQHAAAHAWLDEQLNNPIRVGLPWVSVLAFLGGVASSTKLISDAHLATLAIEHGLLLCSSDGDFARFGGLRWQNPIAGQP